MLHANTTRLFVAALALGVVLVAPRSIVAEPMHPTLTLTVFVTGDSGGIAGAKLTFHSTLKGDSDENWSATTDSNGTFTEDVYMDATLTIGVTASGYIDPAPQTMVVPTDVKMDVHFRLAAIVPTSANIRGCIVACDRNASPPPNIPGQVFAFTMNANGLVDPRFTPIAASIDSTNTFNFSPIAAGRYVLWGVPSDHLKYSSNYYGVATTATSCTITDWHNATIITVAAKQQLSSIDIPMETITSTTVGPMWDISGTVTVNAPSITTVPLDSCGIFARDSTGTLLKYAITDATGHFTMTNVPKGVYHVFVDRIGYNVLVSDSIVRCVSTDTQSVSTNFKMVAQDASGVNDASEAVPGALDLRENYPNPFAGSTTMSFVTDRSGLVVLDVRDVLGRVMATVVSGVVSQGEHVAVFNASGLPAGMYFTRLATNGREVMRPMVVTR